jgi:hypothetical protein
MEPKEERILPAVLEAIPGVGCWLSHRTADEARMTCLKVALLVQNFLEWCS